MNPDLSWMRDGACHGKDTNLWFPTDLRGSLAIAAVREAKQICWGCPVLHECVEYSIAHKPFGVWGGMTEDERKRQRARRGIRMQQHRDPLPRKATAA